MIQGNANGHLTNIKQSQTTRDAKYKQARRFDHNHSGNNYRFILAVFQIYYATLNFNKKEAVLSVSASFIVE